MKPHRRNRSKAEDGSESKVDAIVRHKREGLEPPDIQRVMGDEGMPVELGYIYKVVSNERKRLGSGIGPSLTKTRLR